MATIEAGTGVGWFEPSSQKGGIDGDECDGRLKGFSGYITQGSQELPLAIATSERDLAFPPTPGVR